MGIVIIAEAGVNHNGSLDTAKQMVLAAKEAGADYIKFQTFCPEKLVSLSAGKAEYQKRNTKNRESQLEMLQKLALTQEDFLELKEYCQKQGIGFLSTPFDLESIHFLDKLDLDFWKLPSGEITNLPYLLEIGKTGKPVVMSTGMCELEEIEAAITWLKKAGTKEITLLHCNTEYPTPMRDVNLRAMLNLKDIFSLPAGYSDHTQGIEVPIAAAAMGACILEKHFTLDRAMEGPDHLASLEPEELKSMITAVRNVERAMGDGRKVPSESEKKNMAIARKSIVAKCGIKKGELFSEENLTTKRPGTGISPMKWFEVVGKRAERDFETDEIIVLDSK
ncbi:MAG: N-acetylneuraminate synthase [Lachnospiraceae bacterium]|nr:N-acetylneuraminate synthase [Lachnospiraceae bacterium]